MMEKIVTRIMNDRAMIKRGWNAPCVLTNKSYSTILPEETADSAMISWDVFLNDFPAGTSQACERAICRGQANQYTIGRSDQFQSEKRNNPEVEHEARKPGGLVQQP